MMMMVMSVCVCVYGGELAALYIKSSRGEKNVYEVNVGCSSVGENGRRCGRRVPVLGAGAKKVSRPTNRTN
jgi:hypothetical protein